MKNSKAFTRWAKRIKAYQAGEPIPKSMINAIKSALRRVETYSGRRIVANRYLSNDEWDALVLAFIPGEAAVPDPGLGWAITPEQTAQGLAWLNKLPKKHQLFEPEQFSHFTFDGLRMLEHGSSAYHHMKFQPVYRIHLRDGRSIAYAAFPWQSGNRQPGEAPYEVIP